MDRHTVFTKTAKGLMEATGKTSALSRDLRALLKEIDGKATMAQLRAKIGKLSEAKLEESLQSLLERGYIREFSRSGQAAPAPPQAPEQRKSAGGEVDLDFTTAIPTIPALDKKAEEDARRRAQAAEAAARAKAEAEAKAKAAVAEAAARANAEAEAKAKAQAKARAEAEAKAKREAEEIARREAAEKARKEAEEKARREAEEKVRKEAEEKARREAEELRAKLEEERKAREEAERQRKEAEEKARREAEELRARLEEERQAREKAERKAQEEAERQRKEAEERARLEAERKAKEEVERREREEREAREKAEREEREKAEREAQEEAERQRKEAEERARLEEEQKAKEEAERKAKEEAERREREEREAREKAEREEREKAERERKEAEENARIEAEARAREETEESERKAKEESERLAREDAERKEREAREQSEAERKEREEAERKEREEAERKEREEAERKEREDAEREERDKAERERKDAEEKARVEAETHAREAAGESERKEKEEAERKAQQETERAELEGTAAQPSAEQPQASGKSGRSLDDLVKIETDFDALSGASAGEKPETTGPKDSAEDAMLREAEEKARQIDEENARVEAEREAQRKAQEEEKRAEEAQRREEDRQREGQGAPGEAAAVPASFEREHAKAQALAEEQNAETERHFADMEKELEAEQPAAKGGRGRRAPFEHARERHKEHGRERPRAGLGVQADEDEAAAQAPVAAYRTPINWGKPVALGLFLMFVLGLVLIHFISFDGFIPQFEKLASAYLKQPVKIKGMHLSLVPQPHWRLDGVVVGSQGQLKAAQVTAIPELGSMFSDKKAFSSIELESPVLGEEGLLGLLFGKSAGQDFKVARVVAKNAKLDSKNFILPALDAKIAIGENGAWQQIALETPNRKTSLLLKPQGEGAQLEVETNVFSMPFDPSFLVEDFSAKGTLRRGELRLSEFKGGIYGGYLYGSASLKWGAQWSLEGDIKARAMDPGRFAPALIEAGKLEGKAVYSMRAKSYDSIFAAPRMEGSFEIRKGAILGVDLGRLLQGGGVGGKTAFNELTGDFVREAGKTELRRVQLAAGPLSAGGNADAGPGKRIGGRFVAELKSPVANARTSLVLSGTLTDPRFGR